MRKLVVRAAKFLLLSHLIVTSLQELLYNREKRATNFNSQYSAVQLQVSPYLYVPWPMLYNKVDEIILLWNVIKILVALLTLKHKSGMNWFLKDMIQVECLLNIAGGCQCLCYFVE